jgi:hypothetical protein
MPFAVTLISFAAADTYEVSLVRGKNEDGTALLQSEQHPLRDVTQVSVEVRCRDARVNVVIILLGFITIDVVFDRRRDIEGLFRSCETDRHG